MSIENSEYRQEFCTLCALVLFKSKGDTFELRDLYRYYPSIVCSLLLLFDLPWSSRIAWVPHAPYFNMTHDSLTYSSPPTSAATLYFIHSYISLSFHDSYSWVNLSFFRDVILSAIRWYVGASITPSFLLAWALIKALSRISLVSSSRISHLYLYSRIYL